MANAVRTGPLSRNYQHRYFWIQACRLFHQRNLVRRVAIEKVELRAFDDVSAFYGESIYDSHGRQVNGDYFQLKFHVDHAQKIHGLDLAKPKFIGATKYSLLHRLAQATAAGDLPRRMTLVTPWSIDDSDPIRHLVSCADGEMILDPLFDEGATREMKGLREVWRADLGGVSDDKMRAILRHLAIRDNKRQYDLDQELGWALSMAGLAPVDGTQLAHPYVALSDGLVTARAYEHEASSLEGYLKQAGLWIGPQGTQGPPSEALGIKSFSPFAVYLEDDAKVLNLVPFFHGRQTKAAVGWDRDLFAPIEDFLTRHVHAGGRYDLYFDTHLSIAFASGLMLDKADAVVTPIQRLPGGRLRWADEAASETGALLDQPRVIGLGDGPETAIAIEVTHPVAEDVATYLKRSEPAVGKVVVFTVAGGPSRTSVRDGHHAHALASALGIAVRDLRPAAERTRPLHVFAAAPVALAFLIGRQAAPWGPTITYEFDFDTKAPGAYSPAFHLPPMREETR